MDTGLFAKPMYVPVRTKFTYRSRILQRRLHPARAESCNRVSQNLKVEDLDLNSYDYEKEGKNQGKN